MNELFEHAGTAIAQSEVISFNFNGSAVRTLKDANGEPWFVAKDVAEILGYTDTQAMTRRLDDDEISSCTDKSSGQGRRITIINESGLYNAILGSNKPESKTFKRWVTGEVLPSIRKHGGYLTPAKIEEALLNPDTIIQLATTLKQERQARQIAEETVKEQKTQLMLQAPKVQYCNDVLAAENLHTVNSIATHLGISAMRLNKWLVEEGFIYKQGGIYYPSCKIRDKGYCDFHVVPYINSNGDKMTREHLKWSESGRKAVIELWNKRHNSGKGA